jgi:hypothetical protein
MNMPATTKLEPPADLYPLWRRLGVSFAGASACCSVDVEKLIVETARVASTDERLTVCAASWLAQFHDLVDGRRLSEMARGADRRTLAYLGALLSLAVEGNDGAGRAPQFLSTLQHCKPLAIPQPFYDVVACKPTSRAWIRKHSAKLYSKWRLWHDDIGLQHRSIRSLEQVLQAPELRTRSLLGPSIEANCVSLTIETTTNARALSIKLGATYSATHAAVERLVGRGLLSRNRAGTSQVLTLTPWCRAALSS